MNKYLILFFLNTIPLLCLAQNTYNSGNMVVSKADIENKTYSNDSTANAFYIYEKGYSRIKNGGNYNLLTDFEAKIKILNRQGFNHATVTVLLYKNKKNKELFKNLVAHTHNLENDKVTKIKIDDDKVYIEKYNENYTLVKFTFPNVKPGSVLTYKYQIESPFVYKFNGWDFQDDIPKMNSEFIADLPGNYVYNIKLIGTIKLDTSNSTIKKKCLEISNGAYSNCSHNVYIMKNIPAFKEEKYMTAKHNYLSRIEFDLKEFRGFDGTVKKYTNTWKNVDYELKKETTIGVQLKKLAIIKNILPKTIQSMPNDLKKAKLIYQYVTDNYQWNKKNKIFKEGSITDVLKEKTGNVNGINILLHNILKQQQFKVYPVLLSTRDNGYVTKLHPVISDFNYLIIQLTLDGEEYLLDATEKKLTFGQIPFRCLNHFGRLLDFKNGSSWIPIKPKYHSSSFYKEELKLNEELVLEGNASYTYSGYNAYFKRKEFNQNPNSFFNKIKDQNQDISIINHEIKNENNLEKAIQVNFSFTRNTLEVDNIIYISPFTTPFFTTNPLKVNQRTHPIDFGYKDFYTYTVSLELPSNYEFMEIPKNSVLQIPNKLGSVGINFLKTENNKLIITHRVSFDSSYYPIEYHKILKNFFKTIVEIENESLIMVKKVN